MIKAPVQRCLESVIVRTGCRLDVLNLAESLVRTQEIHGQRARACNVGARGRSRVLILSKVGGAVVRAIDTSALQQMRTECADIRDIHHGLEWKLVLNTEIEGVSCRHLSLTFEGHKTRRRQQYGSASNILHPSIKEGGLYGDRRILNEIEDGVALRAIVEHPAAAANSHSLIPEDVV